MSVDYRKKKKTARNRYRYSTWKMGKPLCKSSQFWVSVSLPRIFVTTWSKSTISKTGSCGWLICSDPDYVLLSASLARRPVTWAILFPTPLRLRCGLILAQLVPRGFYRALPSAWLQPRATRRAAGGPVRPRTTIASSNYGMQQGSCEQRQNYDRQSGCALNVKYLREVIARAKRLPSDSLGEQSKLMRHLCINDKTLELMTHAALWNDYPVSNFPVRKAPPTLVSLCFWGSVSLNAVELHWYFADDSPNRTQSDLHQ